MAINDNTDCYGYMRLTHLLTVCWGYPITRRRVDDNSKYDVDSIVEGYRYTFDWRIVPIWLAYLMLDAFIIYFNYMVALEYVGESFKKCFERTYCIDIIEMTLRNIGPISALICMMFYGYRYKVASLTGTERILRFLRDTDDDDHHSTVRLSTIAKYYSATLVVIYSILLWLNTNHVSPIIMVLFIINSMGQGVMFNLAIFQYYMLERGYARINQLLEITNVHRNQESTHRLLAQLSDAHDNLGRLVEYLNQAYVPSLLLRWPYTVIRLIMVVIHIIEMLPTIQYVDNPFTNVTIVLIMEKVGEIMFFLVQLICFSAAGSRLNYQAGKTMASLQKLKQGYQLNSDVKKIINIFWIRINARKVNATIGGFIDINMNFLKSICDVIATYFLVIIQFKRQKEQIKTTE